MKSRAEEIIATLWFISGLLCWIIGWHIFAILLFIKAAFDVACSIKVAITEVIEEEINKLGTNK